MWQSGTLRAVIAVSSCLAAANRADRSSTAEAGGTLSDLGSDKPSSATLSYSEGSLSLATSTDVAAVKEWAAEWITAVQKKLDDSTTNAFAEIDKQVSHQVNVLREAARELALQATERYSLLQVREMRMTMANHHHIAGLGKCCCVPSSEAVCAWVSWSSLEGRDHMCPRSVGIDYLDHIDAKATKTETIYGKRFAADKKITAGKERYEVSVDSLLDACLSSPGWVKHYHGVTVVPEDAPPHLLTQIEQIATFRMGGVAASSSGGHWPQPQPQLGAFGSGLGGGLGGIGDGLGEAHSGALSGSGGAPATMTASQDFWQLLGMDAASGNLEHNWAERRV